ncbi:MAG: hypothetical protein QT05_C0049G0023 [archaeon GW2011_AR13]|nr:MAG: hypothetical protein QT05_C0049G0023 [archaeon GW2011_AR13]HIG94513.1 hypothetical protein [Nanoarchaeota archaeon]HIH63050.1 hypothetical protein [Nanoarchaeota archaeon]HIJ09523.1 hypothetical protein [Nanoarchaeota archaeon]
MKNRIIITSIIVLIVIITVGFILFNNSQKQPEKIYSAEYKTLLDEIERGNKYIISSNLKDSCFPYRYYDRGCYYTGKLKFYEGLLISTFANTNLTHEEKVELCYKFAFKGSTAWCLRGNAENEMEKQDCLNFAGDNNYLIRICNLEGEEVIPASLTTEGNTLHDEESIIPYVHYSDLI